MADSALLIRPFLQLVALELWNINCLKWRWNNVKENFVFDSEFGIQNKTNRLSQFVSNLNEVCFVPVQTSTNSPKLSKRTFFTVLAKLNYLNPPPPRKKKLQQLYSVHARLDLKLLCDCSDFCWWTQNNKIWTLQNYYF